MLVGEPDGDRAVLDLADGARMTELVLGGRSLLVPFAGQPPMWWGAFVMAPWASMLRDAVVTPRGRLDPPPGVAAWHGSVRTTEWIDEGPGRASAAIPGPWPFGGLAGLELLVTPGEMRLELSVTAGEEGMPAAVGWHPWFVRELAGSAAEVLVDADTLAQERGADDVPTGGWVRPTRRWNDGVRTGPVDVRYPGVGMLSLAWSSPFAILFTESGQGVCVEPVTSPAERLDDVLAPGETLRLGIRVAFISEA